MTFLEAALQILRRERRPLHYKEITDRAIAKSLLTFVGRTPEVTMQTQLTAAVKKAPGNPFVRVKPGVFGLLRYPETAPEPEAPAEASEPRTGEEARSDGGATEERAAADERGGRRRRRRGRRGRGRAEGAEGAEPAEAAAAPGEAQGDDEGEEPDVASLSAEDRAAALAESMSEAEAEGSDDDDDLEDDGDEAEGDEVSESGVDEGTAVARDDQERVAAVTEEPAGAGAFSADGADEGDAEAGDEDEGEAPEGAAFGGEAGEAGGRRRRRRRRRRRGGAENGAFEGGFGGGEAGAEAAAPSGAAVEARPSEGSEAAAAGEGGEVSGEAGEPSAEGGAAESPQPTAAGRRIMTPVDAAIEILRGQAPGRGVHVRQIADAAIRRRLVHGEPHEAWRVMRAALAAEPRERLRAGVRPRVRPAGSGLFALARRPPDADLERSEHVFGEARRALRERTLAALEQKLTELAPGAFEALARVLLQREGFGPATFVKRVEGTVYLETLRGRGFRPSKCLVALRSGGASAGRRSVGELRAGVKARNQDEGLLVLAARLGDDAIAEWKQAGPPIEVVDGPALAEACVRHGVGVISANVSVEFVDADFFAELTEG